MKYKFLLLFAAGSLILNSCDSDRDESDASERKMLVSKITTVYYSEDGTDTDVDILRYNQSGQVERMESGDVYAVMEYDGSGKPLKTLYYEADKTLDYTANYIYSDNQLVSLKSTYSNSAYNREVFFTYNNAGKVTSVKNCQSASCTDAYIDTYQYDGDNITTETLDFQTSYSSKRDYKYDNSLNPFTNINPYLRIMIGGAMGLSKNNYTSEKVSYRMGNNWESGELINYTYQYNSENFPTEVTGKDQNGKLYVKYYYEYITK